MFDPTSALRTPQVESAPMDELVRGIRRVTLPLPTRPGHVHAYLLPGDDGWTLVDTGIGLPDAKETWSAELAQAGGRVATIFVTHFHPDHIGAAADLHELTGAPVVQGALDYAQCELVWGNPAWSERIRDWFQLHGAPDDVTAELVGQSSVYRPFIRYQRDPILVEPGERVDGWELVAAPGHADGQLCLLKDGVLIAADHLLGRITPTVGLWPASRAGSARRLPRRARPDDRARPRARASRPRRADRRSGRSRARAEGAPSPPARGDRRGARGRAEDGIRPLVRALRRRPPAGGTAVRGRRDALARRAARARGRRPTARGRRDRYLYCGLIDGRRASRLVPAPLAGHEHSSANRRRLPARARERDLRRGRVRARHRAAQPPRGARACAAAAARGRRFG